MILAPLQILGQNKIKSVRLKRKKKKSVIMDIGLNCMSASTNQMGKEKKKIYPSYMVQLYLSQYLSLISVYLIYPLFLCYNIFDFNHCI